MPAPTSINELLELTRKSGIVDEAKLANYLQQLRIQQQIPTEPTKLAGYMVRDGLLTMFQAEQLLMGKWKRFTIGKYKVLERLGSGGMGQVFLCEHKVMKRRVAIKVLPTAKADDSSSLERFHREARVVAALDHINIVRAYDIDQDENLHFLVMEYVDGASMQDIVKKFGPMDPLRACHYVYQSALGLQNAFDVAGIIHRDIKPGNVLIDRQGVVKILDMGLARFFHDEEDLLTKQYDETVLGTADYLAPEQAIDSHSVDMRADIYSLGATFYFLLTGNPPFTEGTVAQKLIWHQTKEPKPISAIRPEVPREIVAIVEKMMAKDREHRYQKHSEVAEALAPLITTPIPPPPEQEMPRLSLAAMGTTPTSSSPATRILGPASPVPTRTTSRSELGVPATVAKPATPRPTAPAPQPRRAPAFDTSFPAAPAPPPPLVPPRPITSAAPVVKEEAPVWETIAAETPSPSTGGSETGRNRPAKAPSTKIQGAGPTVTRGSGHMKWVLLIGAGLLLGAIGVAAAFALGVFGPRKEKGAAPNPPELPSLLVDTSPSPQPNSLPKVALALARAKPGDRITVRGPAVEELWTNVEANRFPSNVTIEAEVSPGQYMPWRLPATADPKAILVAANMNGLRFKNFVFDGQGRAETGIYLFARCPGVTFENCRVQNCRQAGVKLVNVAGEPDRPVTLNGLRISGGAGTNALVHLFASPSVASIPANRHITIQDCIGDGPSGAVVLIEGSASNIAIQRNRFAQAERGVVVRPVKDTLWSQVVLESNTFHQISQSAIALDGTTDNAPDGASLAFRSNLFTNCQSLFQQSGDKPLPNLESKANAWDTMNSSDAPKLDGQAIGTVKYLSTNPDDTSSLFLRYAKNSRAYQLPQGPVGVPPLD